MRLAGAGSEAIIMPLRDAISIHTTELNTTAELKNERVGQLLDVVKVLHQQGGPLRGGLQPDTEDCDGGGSRVK